jgi:adenylosuccinate synthase
MGVITNAGPNSGHTSWFDDKKIVLKQLPTFAVHSHLLGRTLPVYFSAGAVIDPEILIAEHKRYPEIPIFIHPNAAVVHEYDKEAECDPEGSIFAVAGTRSGTGSVIARKVRRDPSAIYYNHSQRIFPYYWRIDNANLTPYFMEISQGFSLGLNDPIFYPKVTSRECTFAQGMSDARIAMPHYKRGYLCFRTFPIRVGNVDGLSSGDWHSDQHEIIWDDIGVPAELTTVTKRERRVATFSWNQFYDAITANDPTHVFINFIQYLAKEHQDEFIKACSSPSHKLISGYGPRVEDVKFNEQ